MAVMSGVNASEPERGSTAAPALSSACATSVCCCPQLCLHVNSNAVSRSLYEHGDSAAPALISNCSRSQGPHSLPTHSTGRIASAPDSPDTGTVFGWEQATSGTGSNSPVGRRSRTLTTST